MFILILIQDSKTSDESQEIVAQENLQSSGQPAAAETPMPPFYKKYFNNVYKSNDGNIFLSGVAERIETASILMAPENAGRGLMFTAYFWPVKMVRIDTDAAAADQVYAYSQAPAEYQSLGYAICTSQ
jgi:hypothetical protein